MGVDFFDCDVCGRSVCDCGDYESCECGKHWCSLECAEEDGYQNEEENEDNDLYSSCKYCREEDFEDGELLEYMMKVYNFSRENLIIQYKKSK